MLDLTEKILTRTHSPLVTSYNNDLKTLQSFKRFQFPINLRFAYNHHIIDSCLPNRL